MVISGEIVVFKKKRSVLEDELSKIFPKVDGTYDYLLNIKTYQYTAESVDALLKESQDLRRELEILKATKHIDMWKLDIKNM
jgi:DNA topoisomerase-2